MATASGWRGRKRKREEQAGHRWQTGKREESSPQRTRRFGFFIHSAICLAAFVVLLGLFLYNVLFAPTKTLLITSAVTQYDLPFPENAWAVEDIDAYRDLDGKTLDVVDLSSRWRTGSLGLQYLGAELQKIAGDRRRETVLVSLSMHGAVNDQGEACLIPPEASPTDASSWIPVSRVLDLFRRLDADVNKLLILDCSRMPTNWSAGVLYNDFSERLDEAVNRANIERLYVFNSSRAGQRGWSSTALEGSVFGYYLQRALAGAADQPEEDGDGNRVVSLQEALRYTRHHVRQWVRRNRQDQQDPILLPRTPKNASPPDFDLVWAYSQEFEPAKIEPPQPTLAEEELDALWNLRSNPQSFEEVRENGYRFAPLKWRTFQQRLLHLERLARAGRGYEVQARSVFAELKQLAAEIRPAQTPENLAAFNLPLTERFGRLPESAERLREVRAALGPKGKPEELGETSYPARVQAVWKEVLANRAPGQASVAGLLKFVRLPSADFEPGLIEHHYLRMLNENLSAGGWQNGPLLAQSLEVLDAGERAASPTDFRSHYWLRTHVESGDGDRRGGQDALFVGQRELLVAAQERFALASNHYERAQQEADHAGKALAVRDRAFAELPYLAQWLARPFPLSRGQDAREADRLIETRLLPLFDQTEELANAIERSLQTGAEGAESLAALADEVDQSLDELKQDFFDECNRLTARSSSSAATLRDIEAALAIPLVPPLQRGELRRSHSRIALELARDFRPTATGTAESQADQQSAQDYLTRQLAWSVHPVLRVLLRKQAAAAPALDRSGEKSGQPDDAIDERLLQVDQQNALVRKRLAALPSEAARSLQDSNQKMLSPNQREADVRAERARADRLIRKAGSLWFQLEGENPVEELQRLDLHNLLVWHTRRVLDDFWGSAQGQREDYFTLASQAYLDSSRRLCQSSTGQRPAQDEPVVKRRTTLLDAARNGAEPTARDLLVFDATGKVPHEVSLEVSPDLPPGQAAYFVQGASGQLTLEDFSNQVLGRLGLSLPLPINADTGEPRRFATLPYQMRAEELAQNGPTLDAVALYRGHRWMSQFHTNPTVGAEIVYEPPPALDPTITVLGEARKRGSVVFILDCSWSMNESARLEAAGARQPDVRDAETEENNNEQDSKVRRIDVAKYALDAMLTQLAKQKDFWVGVYFFGHRRAYIRGLDKTEDQKAYANAENIPDKVEPSTDVEQVVNLGRFTERQRNHVSGLLKTVKGWGVTPLYLAMMQAITDLAQDKDESQKSIVVITDGRNYQFNAENPTNLQDVLAALENRNISIHIVGFENIRREDAAAVEEFEALARRTGGRFTEVSEATALVRALQRSLGPNEYLVRDVEGKIVQDKAGQLIGKQEVGYPIQIELPQDRGAERNLYTVEVPTAEGKVSAEVELEGGEALELYLSAGGRKLVHHRYDKGNPVFSAPVPAEPVAERYIVGAHRPRWDRRNVTFPLSVQRHDATQFSRRPAEYWVEIAPVLETGLGSKYVYFDRYFEPNRPVPVLGCTARNWPEGSKEAEVNVWWKYKTTKPNLSVKLSEALSRQPSYEKGIPVPGVPGVTFKVQVKAGNPIRVVVLEQYTPQAENLYAMKTEIRPGANKISRRYDPENRLVIHTFYFENTTEQKVTDYHELVFTSRDALHDDAFHVRKLRVPVPDSMDVIRFPERGR